MAASRRLLYVLLILAFLFSLLSAKSQSQDSQEEEEEDTPVTRYQRYLRFNTAHPDPNYTAPISFLIDQAQSLALNVRSLEFVPGKPVLLLTWRGSDPSLPSILFNSHLDSVPAEPAKWLHPPFSAFRTPTGEIFARGAQDDKCIGMQYLEAIRSLKSRAFAPLRTVHVSYVPDEEIGGFHGMEKFADSQEFRELNVGFVMDERQASPGDEFRVFYADRTPWGLVLKATGTPGHGSRDV
ncbi:aminoacylase-1 [Carica papaya]|uniref:aminoacylase-1 n=1 Tax=Carica papaya TaxID=3649 RepID=UPI000B8C97E8|nr:aminoacylase-1 [Carica papaya]